MSTLERLKNAAKVFAVAMQKGGVGKTVTSINLAYEFAKMGLRVLLIDLDQQANATRGLGIDPNTVEATMYEVLTPDPDDRMPLAAVIVKTEFGIDVAPAHLVLRKLEEGMGRLGEMRLAAQLEELTGYDIVIIDCPPGLGKLSIAALVAAQSVIAPVSPGSDELEALMELEKSVEDVRQLVKSNVQVDHVLVTDYDSRDRLSKDIRLLISRDWEEQYVGTISRTVRVKESKANRLPLALFAPSATATEDYRLAAAKIAEKERIAVK